MALDRIKIVEKREIEFFALRQFLYDGGGIQFNLICEDRSRNYHADGRNGKKGYVSSNSNFKFIIMFFINFNNGNLE